MSIKFSVKNFISPELITVDFQSLVCISCFREIGLSKRTHCLDIETAHSTLQNALCKSIEYTTTTQSSLSELLDKIDSIISETNDSSQKVSSRLLTVHIWSHVFLSHFN